ncbi:MAG: hypothetical protein HY925_00035 [Elusimicrobia bacterium]|nr:hypothetical protein [Elusimicrobiota bacterium]
MGGSELIALLDQSDYPLLKSRLSGGVPAAEWRKLSPLRKLAVFKLLSPDAAMAFFSKLDFADKYLIFSGFEHGSIAPLTEGLPPGRRALFEKLGSDAYGEMLRQLSA